MSDSFEDKMVEVYKQMRVYAKKVLKIYKQDVDDFTQEIMEKVIVKKHDFEDKSIEHILNYCLKSIKNMEINKYRHEVIKTAKHKEIKGEHQGGKKSRETGKTSTPVLMESNEDIENKDESRLDKCMDNLSKDKKEVIIFRLKENKSYAQIAEILKIPIGTVMSKLARAKLDLAKCLKIKMEGK